MASLTHDDYTIAWISALPLEMAAASVMLDKTHNPLPQPVTDPNAYVLGELSGHCIVMACLPTGVYGTISAATVMSHMISTFSSDPVWFDGGNWRGVPSTSNDIRLGDVVVSKPVGKYSGMIQYDYGKAVQGGQFEPTGTLNKPPQTLLTHMAYLEATQMTKRDDAVAKIVLEVLEQNPDVNGRLLPPKWPTDYLFHSSYPHADKESNCEKCDKAHTPYIHYGLIASGDQVMKDSETRDRLAQQYGILCFEMEAAGLVEGLPTLVIRGICDYCDSHKQKEWQGYAALTAAAYTKFPLSVIPVSRSGSRLRKKAKKARHWMVPLARNPRFVGRQDEISKLEELIAMQDGPRKVAITGLGGVGKTQLPCISHGTIEQAYLNMAQTLGLQDVKTTDIKEQIKIYLSSERAGKWLMVFDNADDVDMWLPAGDAAPILEELLPESEQGRILFTTRNRKLAVDLTSSNIVPIPHGDKEIALKIFEKSLVQNGLLEDYITTVSLLEQLTFLPLAITQASAYINKNCLRRYKDIQNPVITTWLISFKQIHRQDQLAADYLSFMACTNPRNIPHLHRLMHIVTRNWLRKNALFMLWQEYLPHALALAYEDEFIIQREQYVDLVAKIAGCLSSDGRYHEAEVLYSDLLKIKQVKDGPEHPNTLTSMANLASTFWKQGRWNEAEKLELEVLETRKAVLGAEHPDTLTSMANLAATYRNQGRWNEAEKLLVQVVEKSKTVLGTEHPSTLRSMGDLAGTYWDQGRWSEAEKLEMQVMEISKTVLGAEHPDTLRSVVNLASTYWNQGQWNEAEKLLMQVMDTSETVLGADHPSTLRIMANLGATYCKQGRWSEAGKLQIQVMKTRKAALGAEHPDTLITMNNLAATYRNQGRWNEAEKLLTQVLEIYKTVLGEEHPDTLRSMANLAETYRSQERWSEADKIFMQVMETRKTVLGAEHPDTLTIMASLAYTRNPKGSFRMPLL
ncbi:hypothetical protein BDV23DRAFT_192368 [Aspergillus alliaceus]|uniref:Nucleoside phosphorylase domain-containing protein n=1 Tax=Petromyces alliaceus TaxID=209559 RepID=A0A5N7CG69_PETAA|nr:hypothetical protein BDV23DRAFT_192368 [Aspergillus alliaceus]